MVPAYRTTLQTINDCLKFMFDRCWIGEVRGPLPVMSEGKVCERHFVLLFWKPPLGFGLEQQTRSQWYFFDLPVLG